MGDKKKEHPREKTRLHERNKHRERYDFKLLIECCPELSEFVSPNIYGDDSVDFFNPQAVKILNKALLMHYYDLKFWEIPQDYLCPPIPGRADYIHHVADLLAGSNYGKIPTGSKIKCLDIGVGANFVYPIIGNKEYGWSFVGSDIDPVAIASSNKIIEENPHLEESMECRLQTKSTDTFYGVIKKGERYDLTICNPPFNASLEEARSGAKRKVSNLKREKVKSPELNFGGQPNELWCEGGEKTFIQNMIQQSKQFGQQCCWFTTLVSKQSHLKHVYEELNKADVAEYKTISMGQGNKTSRIVVWTFLSVEDEKQWAANNF